MLLEPQKERRKNTIGNCIFPIQSWKNIQRNMAEVFSKLAKDINLPILEAEQTPTMINLKKLTPHLIMIKLQVTNNQGKILKQLEMTCNLWGETDLSDSDFLIRNQGG